MQCSSSVHVRVCTTTYVYVCHLILTTTHTQFKGSQLPRYHRVKGEQSSHAPKHVCVAQDTEVFHGLPQSLQQKLGQYLNQAITSQIICPSDTVHYSLPLSV